MIKVEVDRSQIVAFVAAMSVTFYLTATKTRYSKGHPVEPTTRVNLVGYSRKQRVYACSHSRGDDSGWSREARGVHRG